MLFKDAQHLVFIWRLFLDCESDFYIFQSLCRCDSAREVGRQSPAEASIPCIVEHYGVRDLSDS